MENLPHKPSFMRKLSRTPTAGILLMLAVILPSGQPARAAYLDTIGVTLLQAVTNLNGAGVTVGQAEAGNESPTNWEVNPGDVGQPTNRFTYFYGTSPYAVVSSTNTYPNSLGGPSGHAGIVAGVYYGMPGGVATNVAHVNNYEANTFINHYVYLGNTISERIVNQSFTYGSYDTNADQIYDNYAAQNGVLFVTGAGFNGQPVYSPATCYNGIGVGSTAFNSPNGPTLDGRSKPDIIASDFAETSYTTPQVAGAAALLMQAGLRGDGGSGGTTNLAVDIRTLKALLLNGAVKPAGWTNSPATPLHPLYGAGMVNVFNAYYQLIGGKRGYVVSASVTTNSPHPPTGATGTVSVLNGWDFNTNSSSASTDGVNHYFFNVTNGQHNAAFMVAATLVWNRHKNTNIINNLDLFLYDTASSNLVLCSTSRVDNVEHLWWPQLPQGRYDLQVLKSGGTNVVSNPETYALAWAFAAPTLNLTKSGTNVALMWPVYPAGFRAETTSSLESPAWNISNPSSSVVTNSMNRLILNVTDAQQFFRLRQPDF
jgi:hypothetical protein